MITIKQLEDRVHKARRHVILDIPMAQSSAVKMGIFFSNAIPTAATDGRMVGFNPLFTASLDEQELEFVVAHEWCHKILRHHARGMKIRSSFRNTWTSFHENILNEAADEEGNFLLEKTGFKVLNGSCRDVRFDGMPMEEIFQILLHERTAPADEPQEEDGRSPDGEDQGEESQEDEVRYGKPFNNEVIIQADENTHFQVLVKVLYTCGQSEFNKLRLLTYQEKI